MTEDGVSWMRAGYVTALDRLIPRRGEETSPEKEVDALNVRGGEKKSPVSNICLDTTLCG